MKTNLLYGALCLLLTLLVGCSSHGTPEGLRKPRVDYATMVKETEAVVLATVVTAEPKLDELEGRVYTYHSLHGDQVIHGKIDPVMALPMRIRGGTAEGVTIESATRPELSGFYPAASWQSMAKVEGGRLIPVYDAEDHPLAKWRGMELSQVLPQLRAKP
jgi:hypothetical protein